MTIEFQWFGPLSMILTLLLCGLGFWIGKKIGGLIGAVIGVALFIVIYSISGTYGPKLAIDSTPIQDIRRDRAEIHKPKITDYEPRFEERVKGMRDDVLKGDSQ